MFRSLYSKMAAVLTIIFIVLGIVFVTVTLFSTEMYQQEVNQRLNIDLASHIVSEKILIKESRVDNKALADVFHMLMVINPSIEIYLVDPEGKILAFSAPQEKVKRTHIDTGPIHRLLSNREKIPIMGDDPRDFSGKKVFTATRIPETGNLEGYLYVILGGEAYDSVVQKLKASYILRLSSWMIAASLFFALAAGLILFAFLTRKLKRLAKIVSETNVNEPLNFDSLPSINPHGKGDEIDLLAATLKQMEAQIQDQMNKLRQTDQLRRELVANVSHDLRTPLSTLQGYIETLLLKEADLSTDERREYLKTAIRHCVRLGTLVSELLELAKLESGMVLLNMEKFNLNELIQDVIQKFSLKAKEKEINLTAPLDISLPFVIGDIGLIERVLENLIENAVHYTPEGGQVELALTHDQGQVSVQVKDTGDGIPEEEIPNIFQRFYRPDKIHESNSGHSGLGLAIAGKILEMHKSKIHLESRIKSGSVFSFRLATQ